MKRILFYVMLLGSLATPTALKPMNCLINCFEWKMPHETTRLGCFHLNCTECLIDGVERAINRGDLRAIQCNEPRCHRVLALNEVRILLGNGSAEFRAYENLQREADRSRGQGLSTEKREVLRTNPNVRACPDCHHLMERISGCNHMTCPVANRGCGYQFCWECGQQWRRDANHPTYYRCVAPPSEWTWAQPPIPKNYTVHYIIGGLVVAAASYGAYKLYKYLNAPTPYAYKNLKTSMFDLHNQAIKAKGVLSKGMYVRNSFKNYFAFQEASNAFKDLTETQKQALQQIVADLEVAFCTGQFDQEYNALVQFIIALNTQEVSGAPVVADTRDVARQPRARQAARKRSAPRGRAKKVK